MGATALKNGRAYKVAVLHKDTKDYKKGDCLLNIMTISNTTSVQDDDLYYKTNEYVRKR